MVPRLLSSGQSFAGLGKYLCHDPKSSTKERVAWTHTLNCASDDVPSAINEMFWTYRNAGLLKEEAGIRAGGRALEKPVKHFSLNWAPDEELTKEQMAEATESFLKWMKWDEHQAVMVAHSDKKHQHVHVMLNAIHPETGIKLDDRFEKRRAQEWALQYERSTGRIYCEQRLENLEDRESSMTREAWLTFQEFQKAHEGAEAERRRYDPDYLQSQKNRAVINSEEWGLLKEMQRKEREAFHADGKIEFKELRNSIYQEVREEFRDGWAAYYQAKRDGLDHGQLEETRASLIAEQASVLKARRDEACIALRETRDEGYKILLAEHREDRRQLTSRQADGLSSPHLLDYVNLEAE